VLPISPLIYALGDVHGRADLLDEVLRFVEKDSARRRDDPKVMFLGDIVDRGPDSRLAMDLVVETLRRWPKSRLVLGNHDDWFLSFLNGVEADRWRRQGGTEALLSYVPMDTSPDEAREVIRNSHSEHARILDEASIIEIDGEYAFVHAGIDPVQPLDRQDRETCLWIREGFLDHVGRLSHVIVHGHSPMLNPPLPVVTENRISLDTGAVLTGVLSVLVIDRAMDRVEFFATRDGAVGPVDPVRLDRGHGVVVD
jgi:serine/threonine protein phosphatase 1